MVDAHLQLGLRVSALRVRLPVDQKFVLLAAILFDDLHEFGGKERHFVAGAFVDVGDDRFFCDIEVRICRGAFIQKVRSLKAHASTSLYISLS